MQRWRNSVNIELEKRFVERLVHQLTTIHLLEVNFNTGTKSSLGKRVIGKAMKYNQITPELFAAKVQQGIDAILVKQFF